jgi:hypothetical protein
LLGIAACLIFTGCSTGGSAQTGAAAHDHKPSLDVKLDISGRQITVKVISDMHISAEHLGKTRVQGEGHIHLYLDDGEKSIVTGWEQTFKDLAPGTHTLKISLHNNDHTPYDVTITKNFEIKS